MADAQATTPLKDRFPGLLGTKLGMTQVYDDKGVLLAVTVVKAGPCVVVQRKGTEGDGYAALQLGLVEEGRTRKRTDKATAGHFNKTGAGAAPVRYVREVRLPSDDSRPDLAAGKQLTAADLAPGDLVDVISTSKGKGFQGVVRRHNFSGGAATHGSMFHRAPGSIGASAFPSRVFKGMRMGGHMGADRVTAKNLSVVRVELDSNLVFLKGAVPGGKNAVVMLRPSRAGKRLKKIAGQAAREAAAKAEKPGKKEK